MIKWVGVAWSYLYILAETYLLPLIYLWRRIRPFLDGALTWFNALRLNFKIINDEIRFIEKNLDLKLSWARCGYICGS